MQSNFEFLNKAFPILTQIGSIAESYLYSDTNSCLIKLGMFGETTVNLMLQLDNIDPPTIDNTHANRIRLLKQNGLIPRYIDDILYALRTNRNNAIHQNFESEEQCKTLLKMAHTLSVWFMQTYHNQEFIAKSFILPENKQENYQEVILEQETHIKDLTAKLNEIKAKPIDIAQRSKRGIDAATSIHLSEKETRYIIDEQLRKAGWEADTENLRYSKGTRPQKGKNLVIAEWLTDSTVGKCGYADYAFFVGLKLVAVAEAKAKHTDISSVIDNQSKDYSKGIKEEHFKYCINHWNGYHTPFIFATNGRKYLKQWETKSGIWFLDVRQKDNIPKALKGWLSPDGIMELLQQDIEKANNKLNETGYDLLSDKDGLNLREYQINAIEAAEKAIIDGAQTALLAMATGTGKTRTILGLIYRLLFTGRFKRVLFLVDRTALGEQTQGVFKDVKIENLMTLNSIYNIKNLEDKEIDKETKVQIATVQSLVHRIMYSDTPPSVSDYDLIIVDEAHRGYIIDKDMSADQLEYRDQEDFISKYRTVIDYFNAVKIALTATPALHTTEIFGKPVFNYSYREAVIEGYLIDHDAPHTIKTKLSTEGIHYDKGEIVLLRNPITGEILNNYELQDEIDFDIEDFNRKVITESFNRTALKEICKNINPMGDGKTLIYAVNDVHADLIVTILRGIYEKNGVDHDAIMKITGSIGGGNKKKVSEAIQLFKSEKNPNIAVTVDLLTTGIDVPEITTLVFMRRVKSRILFEQMLGRATRLCPEIDKKIFEVYDPVGVYESMQAVNTMKPVVVDPNASFSNLLEDLVEVQDEKQIKNLINLIIAKVQRRKRELNENQRERFSSLTKNKTMSEFIKHILSLPPMDGKAELLSKHSLFAILDEKGEGRTYVIISDKEDELHEHTRGYGAGKKPKDYLNEFSEFIHKNADKIEAMKLICTRPSDLTRQALKSLKLELDRNGFTETQLNTAWKEAKNVDIAADIISFIRAEAMGCELLNHKERITKAVDKLKKNHDFSKMELDWLDRIEKHLLTEIILNEESFNQGAFKTSGGFTQINKAFNNKLKEYIIELNQYLYDDKGTVA